MLAAACTAPNSSQQQETDDKGRPGTRRNQKFRTTGQECAPPGQAGVDTCPPRVRLGSEAHCHAQYSTPFCVRMHDALAGVSNNPSPRLAPRTAPRRTSCNRATVPARSRSVVRSIESDEQAGPGKAKRWSPPRPSQVSCFYCTTVCVHRTCIVQQ